MYKGYTNGPRQTNDRKPTYQNTKPGYQYHPQGPAVQPSRATSTGPRIEISRPTKSISINTVSGIQPKIERKTPINFNPAPMQANPMPPQLQIQRPGMHPEHTTIQVTTSVQRPVSPARSMSVSIGTPQRPTFAPKQTVQVVAPPTVTISKPVSPQQIEQYNKVSLLSFVTQFEEDKSFNETDLGDLGLDLKCQEPLLPMLHSILSDAPLLDKSVLPMPDCYRKIPSLEKPQEKMNMFSKETLMFIFYSMPKTPLQAQAAEELVKHGYTFDEEAGVWKTSNGMIWSVEQWKEVPGQAE